MANWQTIRNRRTDLTDYLIHFTRPCKNVDASGADSLKRILWSGFVRASFARKTVHHGPEENTVVGERSVVCLSDIPIALADESLRLASDRYSPYGIAFHKRIVWSHHGRPVIYGTTDMLGDRIGVESVDYREGLRQYRGGLLPSALHWQWVSYAPFPKDYSGFPSDFTWEREWRVPGDLPLDSTFDIATNEPTGVIVVHRNNEIEQFRGYVRDCEAQGHTWPKSLNRIVSMEMVRRNYQDRRFHRIETLPWDQASESPPP